MSAGTLGPDDEPVDDVSIVPGMELGPSPYPVTGPLDLRGDPDRYDPARDAAVGPLDMSADPDRYDPDAVQLPQRLDPALDPDRFVPPVRRGENETLLDLVGREGAFEEQRDGMGWLLGLAGVFGFLALVAYLFGNVLTP